MGTLACEFGIVYNFEVCTKATEQVLGWPDMGSTSNTVCKLASIIPLHQNHKLIMDDLFSSIPLYTEMYIRGILCMGTVRAERLIGLDVITPRELKARGSSAYIEYEAKLDTCKESLRVVRWLDGDAVNIMSSYSSAQPNGTMGRWVKDISTTEKTELNCPGVVQHYNFAMGGVDKMDSLIALYRIFFKSRKFYHRFFFHFLDESIVNAWLMYRRDSLVLDSNCKCLSLYDFKFNISTCLRMQNKIRINKRGRKSNNEFSAKRKRGPQTRVLLPKSVREDQIGHFAINRTVRGICRVPDCKARPVSYCLK